MKEEVKSYAGIRTKIMKDGTKNIMVRLRHDGTKYHEMNYTKLFECETEEDAYKETIIVKRRIDNGETDPFGKKKSVILNDIWEKYSTEKLEDDTWKKSSYTTYTTNYNKRIRNSIGWKQVHLITYNNIDSIVKSMKGLGKSSKSFIKLILLPVFEECRKNKLIKENIILDLKLKKRKKEENRKISDISHDEPLDIVRKLYNTIPKYENIHKKDTTNEVRAIFYLLLLTAHRLQEMMDLKQEHIILKKDLIITTEDITKTREDYHFPLPPEVKDYLTNNADNEGRFFPNMIQKTLLNRWKQLVQLADVGLKNGKTLTIHDTRRLMLYVMIHDCEIDVVIADACLNHKVQGTIKNYIDIPYPIIEKSFTKFWKIVRNDKDQEEEEEFTLNDIPQDVIEMYKKMKQSKVLQ
ncbi:tyrosine-type recombinase/integrase [Sulfurimonas sp.]|uniref:tyrosine-type recombinase/integrase n=1 Tax=Sulfurimonas sp. TaxID=2022749 RepID=UPI001A0FBF58|nr:tyrosine-type recombinase/integrase [Sulfurimonas sp.]MBE0514218.1 tyrosine-type recombinase/integrase [Sulfurimonas sp.]